MLDIFFSIFVYLLAFYGVIVLIVTVANSIRFRTFRDNDKLKLILLVKDYEENIEGVIRGIFSGEPLIKDFIGEKLTVLDLESKDNTGRILDRLSWEYSGLEVLNESQKEKIFDSFKQDKKL